MSGSASGGVSASGSAASSRSGPSEPRARQRRRGAREPPSRSGWHKAEAVRFGRPRRRGRSDSFSGSADRWTGRAAVEVPTGLDSTREDAPRADGSAWRATVPDRDASCLPSAPVVRSPIRTTSAIPGPGSPRSADRSRCSTSPSCTSRPSWSPSMRRAGCPTRWTALAQLTAPAQPADRDRQRAAPTPPCALLEQALDQGVVDAVYPGKRTVRVRHARSSPHCARTGGRPDEAATRTDVRPTDDSPPADSRWLWLLHDDAVPAPDALRPSCSATCWPTHHRHHRPEAAAAAPAAGRASRSARSASASPAPGGASGCSTRARSTRVSATSRSTARRVDLRNAGQGVGLGRPRRAGPGPAGLP